MHFSAKLRERGGRPDRAALGVSLPASHGFKPSEWTAAYNELADGSMEDRNAFEAGMFLFERMERVRDELRKMSGYVQSFPSDDRVIGLCGFLNTHLIKLVKSHFEHREADVLAIEHSLSARTLGGYPGDKYTVSEALQGMLDGAKHPLRAAIAGAPLGVPTPSSPTIGRDDAIRNEIALGRIYDGFECAWQSVQWSGARLHRRGLEYRFDETDDLHFVESRLDLFRREQRFTRDGLEMLPIVERRFSGAMRVAVPEGDALTVRLVDDLHPDLRRNVIAVQNQRVTTTALEVEPFEEVIHPNFEISISKVLDIWFHLSFIASCCLNQASERSGQQELALAADARKFPTTRLADAIAQCTELDARRVALVLQRLTFSLGPQRGRWDELWDRPLVPSGEHLILVWQPFIGCEYTRLIARLASEVPELQDAHSVKGRYFEKHVAEVLQLAFDRSPVHVRQRAKVLQTRIDPEDKSMGDVDVVLVVGDTAFVMECRAMRNAATSYEYWEVKNELEEKLPKILRKTNYLRRNSGWLEAIAAKQGHALGEKVRRYVAVVVSNNYMFEGCRDAEPFYVHVDTLLNAVLMGGPRFGDVVEGREVEYMADYFGNFANPADAMLRAIAKPAKAEMYRRCLHPGVFPMPGIGDSEDHSGTVQQWALKFPELGHIRSLLDQCSFASMLREVAPSSCGRPAKG